MDRRRQSPSRAGFTLVEVLIAILIIAILMALLVPTLAAAFRKAKEAQVSAEMNNLATALASFKNTYGDYPPSRILFCESGYGSLPAAFLNETVGDATSVTYGEQPLADSNCTDMTNQQLMQRSLLYLRKFWPRVDFINGHFDFNANGTIQTNPYILSGSECLTFFLGGIPINNGAGMITGVSGFSKLPTNPFLAFNPTANPASSNRTVPNYDFNNGRLIDQDGDGIPSYIDPMNSTLGSRRSYAYFSSYGTNSYDPNDVNGYGHNSSPIFETEDIGNSQTPVNVEWRFQVGFPTSSGTAAPYLAVSPAPNPYTSSDSDSGTVSWVNPNSFQIIACGQDGLWGVGGWYVQGGTGALGTLPLPANDPGNVNGDLNRIPENDNLTNFSGGRLN